MPAALHDKAMELYRQYLVIGGLAENYVNVLLTINGCKTYRDFGFEDGRKTVPFCAAFCI